MSAATFAHGANLSMVSASLLLELGIIIYGLVLMKLSTWICKYGPPTALDHVAGRGLSSPRDHQDIPRRIRPRRIGIPHLPYTTYVGPIPAARSLIPPTPSLQRKVSSFLAKARNRIVMQPVEVQYGRSTATYQVSCKIIERPLKLAQDDLTWFLNFLDGVASLPRAANWVPATGSYHSVTKEKGAVMAIIPGEDDNLFCGATTPTDPALQLVNPRMANAACIALVWLLRTALTLAPTISGSTAPESRLSELTPVTSLSPATDLDQAVSYDKVAPYGGEIDVSLPFLRTSTKHSLRLHLPFQHGGFQVGLSFTGTRGRKAAPNSVTLHWRYPELLRPGSWLKPKCDDEPPENHAHQGQRLVNNSDRGSIPLVTFQARKGKPTFLSLNRSLADLMKLARPGMTGRSGLPSGLLFNSPLPTGPAVHVQI